MRAILTILAMFALSAPALAADGEALDLRDGPGGEGRLLDEAWIMRCPEGERLVGLRLRADERIVGAEAICADPAGRAPHVWTLPPGGRTASEAANDRGDGHILHASSRGIARFQGSKALVISVPRRPDPRPAERPAGFRPEPSDLVCPAGRVVTALRTAQAAQGGGLSGVQIVCGGGDGDPLPVGAPLGARGPLVQQVQCGGASANPHDGTAADALLGSGFDGRLQSLGLTCAAR